jgi:hypothetical protein
VQSEQYTLPSDLPGRLKVRTSSKPPQGSLKLRNSYRPPGPRQFAGGLGRRVWTLSHYDVSLSSGTAKLEEVTNPRLFATSYQRNRPQLRLFGLEDALGGGG